MNSENNIVRMIISLILLSFADKTEWFVHSSFNYTLHLISGISSDLRKLLRYFNGTAAAMFFKIPSSLTASVFANNLALSAISTLELVASSLA